LINSGQASPLTNIISRKKFTAVVLAAGALGHTQEIAFTNCKINPKQQEDIDH